MKKPNLPISSTLGRAAGELAIIVAGVLIALAAQSWWENRGEGEERARALRALDADLALIREEMVGDTVFQTRLGEALAIVIRGDDLTVYPDTTATAILHAAFWAHGGRAVFSFPAYQDLESSGRLTLLPDSVRSALTGYANTLGALDNLYQDLQDVQESQVDQWTIENYETARLLWTPGAPYPWPGPASLEPSRTRLARSLAAAKAQVLSAMTDQVREAITETDRLREIIVGSTEDRR